MVDGKIHEIRRKKILEILKISVKIPTDAPKPGNEMGMGPCSAQGIFIFLIFMDEASRSFFSP